LRERVAEKTAICAGAPHIFDPPQAQNKNRTHNQSLRRYNAVALQNNELS
jgi:hypothetical protein